MNYKPFRFQHLKAFGVSLIVSLKYNSVKNENKHLCLEVTLNGEQHLSTDKGSVPHNMAFILDTT